MQKVIILDRDGVINYDSPDYIKSPEEWIPIPGSLEAIAMFNKKGFKVTIASNQSGIGRGYCNYDLLTAIHNKLFTTLKTVNGKIDKIVFCPHTPDDDCLCRKPKPGMLNEILRYFSVDPKHNTVYFVGDSGSDLAAAKAANCYPILVRTGNGNKTVADLSPDEQIPIFDNLLAFAQSL